MGTMIQGMVLFLLTSQSHAQIRMHNNTDGVGWASLCSAGALDQLLQETDVMIDDIIDHEKD